MYVYIKLYTQKAKPSSGNQAHDKAMYILQTKSNNDFMIFHDTGCEDMSCKFPAVQHIEGDHDRSVKVQFSLVVLVF